MTDVISIKVSCAECDKALVFKIENGIVNFAQIKVLVRSCHSCQEDLKENIQKDLGFTEADLEKLKEKIRDLIDE